MENGMETMQEKPGTRVKMKPDDTNTTGAHGLDREADVTGFPGHPGDAARSATAGVPEQIRMQVDAEKKISTNVMSIFLTSDGLVIRDEEREESPDVKRLAGVYCEGVQYYDLNGIQYINHNGMAILIDLLKNLLEMGVEVQFVNVHDAIKKKIRDLGLEKIINYGE